MDILVHDEKPNAGLLEDVFQRVIRASRFTADVYSMDPNSVKGSIRGGVLKILNVRVKGPSRVDCESHPGECVVIPNFFGFEPKRKKSRFLEGSDWVEFDDLLSSICDHMGASATIYSWNRDTDKPGRLYIRKKRERRIVYDCHEVWRNLPFLGNTLIGRAWNNNAPAEHFMDCIGIEAPLSSFIEGTPGSYDPKNGYTAILRALRGTVYEQQITSQHQIIEKSEQATQAAA